MIDAGHSVTSRDGLDYSFAGEGKAKQFINH